MTEREEPEEAASPGVYEIRVSGESRAALRHLPAVTVLSSRTETVLFRQVDRPEQLHDLIENMLSIGLVLTEVHEVREPSACAPEPPAGTSGGRA